jgi:hypothetical protein
MNLTLKKQIRAFGLEMLVYGALIVGYLFLVLRFVGERLHQLFLHDRKIYAWTALAAVVVQGFLLEAITRAILHFLKPKRGGVE